MAHTPGPWSWDGKEIDQVGSPWNTVLRLEVSCGSYCYGGCVDVTISDEDKSLIIASPDLYRVAKDFDEALSELGLHCECGETDCRTTRLRAAIAKAEGK